MKLLIYGTLIGFIRGNFRSTMCLNSETLKRKRFFKFRYIKTPNDIVIQLPLIVEKWMDRKCKVK